MVHQNSNLHDSTLSTVKALLNTLQICANPNVEGIFKTKLGALVREMQEIVLEEFANDTRLYRGERTTFQLSVSSIVNTRNDDYGLEI
jgi:hypothetical protein